MIVDRDALRSRDQKAISQLQRIVKRVCGQVARQHRTTAYTDDIAQETLLTTLSAIDEKRDDEDSLHIEGFIRKTARHKALGYLRAGRRMRGVQDDHEFDANADPAENTPLEATVAVEVRRNARAAAAAATKFRTLNHGAPAAATPQPKPPRRKRIPAKILGKKPTGEELQELRQTLGMTQAQFAKLLNTSIHTLRNYEYGIVKRIPARIIDKARTSEALGRSTGYLTPPPFLTLVRGWMRELGIKPKDYAALAAFFGYNRSTVWRWFNEGVVPARDTIAALTIHVEENTRRRKLHAEGKSV